MKGFPLTSDSNKKKKSNRTPDSRFKCLTRKNVLTTSLKYTSQLKEHTAHDLFNDAESTHWKTLEKKIYINYLQFVSDTHVTLKQSQGHQIWYKFYRP